MALQDGRGRPFDDERHRTVAQVGLCTLELTGDPVGRSATIDGSFLPPNCPSERTRHPFSLTRPTLLLAADETASLRVRLRARARPADRRPFDPSPAVTLHFVFALRGRCL